MPDSESCKESILSEDYMDFISNWRRNNFVDSISMQDSVCRTFLGGNFHGIYLPRIEGGRRALNQLPYFSVPKCYTLLDVEAMNQAGIIQIQNYPNLQLMGDGVIMGIIDTGVDYTNQIFRNLDGSTRIINIWDQTVQDGNPPDNFNYGTEYTKEQIDEALKSENPFDIVPSTDTNGHGNFVASLACGGADVENRFVGAAPESEIAVVKLKEAKQYLREFYFVDADAACYQENDIMAAVHYLVEVSMMEMKPLVICLSMGTNMGGHDGKSPLSELLEGLSNTSGVVVALGTGNEADKRHHYLGQLSTEIQQEEIEVRVGNNTRGFTMELWTEIPNIFEVTIVSPTGERVGRVPVRQGDGFFTFVFEQTDVYVLSRILVEGTSSELISLQFDRPAAGIWKVIVEAVQLGSGRFHVWLPVQEFLTGEVYFLRSNPDYTITEPGNTVSAITSGYYNGADNSIAISSGRGYTRGERIKPDFAAPGINVTGLNARGQFTARSGSSIATAIAAGAGALMLEWLVVRRRAFVDTVQIKNLLILGTSRRPDLTYPNREWGYGTLDLYRTFEEIRRF